MTTIPETYRNDDWPRKVARTVNDISRRIDSGEFTGGFGLGLNMGDASGGSTNALDMGSAS